MPKSKRNKLVTLSRTGLSGKNGKAKLIQSIRDSVENFTYIYIFSLHNVRSSTLKDVRTKWSTSRFFFGKNKVMQVALGKDKESEIKENINQLSQNINGNCGLLFTNEPESKVTEFFENYKESDHPRAGFEATESIILEAGPYPKFDHSMEAYLRTKLGLPSSLKNGQVILEKSYTVCTERVPVSIEGAKILKLLDNRMSTFTMQLECVWSNGDFKMLSKPQMEDEQ